MPGCMLQVAHLVEEAVQPQVVLMTENRRVVHKDAKPGPDFGSVMYGTIRRLWHLALLQRLPLQMPHQVCLGAVLLVPLSSTNL